ncbi:MAG: hypothetical protein GOMPHAMPRED_002320 [Gomphillus americanus]|uniref:Heterokaryon incompatibility domain-containing protein n=1 Tax=Gomphillus americanus TaxID=1940652 RepID=A0A8H3FBX7_9LECA|nr:MAG: hypothetical protein GOMPHAMPRED_002320 [Gomphillus americanus]
MDFLQLPDGVDEHEPVFEIPGIPFDNQGFEGFDIRQGWDLERLRQGDFRRARTEWNDYSQQSLAEANRPASLMTGTELLQNLVGAFLQNWIVYGLFQQALARPVQRAEATRLQKGIDGSSSFSRRTFHLQDLFAEFMSRGQQLASDEQWYASFEKAINLASWVLEDVDLLFDSLQGYVVPPATALLLCSLLHTFHCFIRIWRGSSDNTISSASSIIPKSLQHKLLSEKKWCPERVKRLGSELGPAGLYYVDLLDVPSDGVLHENCKQEKCVAYNVAVRADYRQQHQPKFCPCKDTSCTHDLATCQCRPIGDADLLFQQVTEAVNAESIPLLLVDKQNDGFRIKVTSSHLNQIYIAISHVWSDGLGNPKTNTLLRCQVLMLDACVRRVLEKLQPGSPPMFWIDTICVPLRPQETRDKAIGKMHQVYADAEVVLVIVKDIMCTPLPKTNQERAVRICQSKWFKRLWTMQEGALAKVLGFQFEDHALDWEYLDDALCKNLMDTSNAATLIGAFANLMTGHLRSLSKAKGSWEALFEALWFAMRHRATSRDSDQAVCAAILCSLDVKLVLSVPDDQKMDAFWGICQKVPLGLLLCNGPRLDTAGFRWAPRAFLQPSTWATGLPRTGKTGEVSANGLRFSGFIASPILIDPWPLTLHSVIELFFHDSPMQKLLVRLTQSVDNPTWSKIIGHRNQLCILLDELPSSEMPTSGLLVTCRTKNHADMLEDLSKEACDQWPILESQYLAQLDVFNDDGPWSLMVRTLPAVYEEGDLVDREHVESLVNISGLYQIPRNQKWCID